MPNIKTVPRLPVFSLFALLIGIFAFSAICTAQAPATGESVTDVVIADTKVEAEATLDSGNTAWMITATALVLFMTLPGLALFYGGLVQSKNVLSVLMHCFTIACLMSIVWVVCGYSLALTEGSNEWIGGKEQFFLAALTKMVSTVIFLSPSGSCSK